MQSASYLEDDEVVLELDVNLSQPSADSELFVLQHPLRIPGAGIGTDRMVEGMRVRPQHRRIEMSLSLFPRMDGSGAAYSEKSFDFEEMHTAERPIGETQVLLSTDPEQPVTNLAVAMCAPPAGSHEGTGSITLVPVERVVRMRPSFDYIDELDTERQNERALAKAARDKEKGTLDSVNQIDDHKDADEANDVEIEMTFMRRESERAAGRRKTSYAFLRKLEEEDKWESVTYFEESSAESEYARERLFMTRPTSSDTEDVKPRIALVKKEDDVPQNTAPRTYMDLFYEFEPSANPIREATRRIGDTTAGQGSLRALRTMRPDGAIQIMLTHARIARMEHIVGCVAASTPTDKIIESVRQVAYLLRGCWVRKTPRRARSSMSAHKLPPRINAARLLVFDMFRRNRIVYQSDIYEKTFANMIPPHSELVQSFLEEVAERKVGSGWEFRLEDDIDFEASYQEVVDAEDAAWDERVREAVGVMSGEVGQAGRHARGRSVERR